MYSLDHYLHINAEINKVYEAITTIDGLQSWWTTFTSGSTKLNEIINFDFPPNFYNKMEVVEMIENKKVTWKVIDGESLWIDTFITFSLDTNDGKTRMRFSHSNWVEKKDFFAACNFTWARYLESLRQLCETGQGKPFTN